MAISERQLAYEDATFPDVGWTEVNGLRPTVSVVIPTLNEARNLPFVLPSIPEWVDEVIIVDGRSTDDSVTVARELIDDVIVVYEPMPGKGRALQAGFAAATGDIIVMLDADGSMDPAEIPAFVGALVAGADFVKGSRFMQGGGSDDIELHRRAGNWALTSLVRMTFGGRYSDLCYGYNAFWRDVLPVITDEEAIGFEIETHMNVRILAAGLRVAEVPSFEADRIFGTSNLNTFRDGFRVLRSIVTERVKVARGLGPDRPDMSRRNEFAPAPRRHLAAVHGSD